MATENVTNIAYTDGLLQSSVTTTPASGPAQKVVTNLGQGTVTTIDTVPGGSMQVVSKSWLDDAGRTLETEQYDGKGDTYTTYHAYDDSGRLYWTKDAVGTITETEFDGLGRPTQILVGTNDSVVNGNSSRSSRKSTTTTAWATATSPRPRSIRT